jgi:hypothetical protein
MTFFYGFNVTQISLGSQFSLVGIENWCNGIISYNSSVCNGHGMCVGTNLCQCTDSLWFGDQCQSTFCFGYTSIDSLVCSGNGTCSSPNNCTCTAGYGGFNCNVTMCYDRLQSDQLACTGRNGTCKVPNQCKCQFGYNRTQCEDWICMGISKSDINVCSRSGICDSPDKCICNSIQLIGENCEIPYRTFYILTEISLICTLVLSVSFMIMDLVTLKLLSRCRIIPTKNIQNAVYIDYKEMVGFDSALEVLLKKE